MKFRGKHKGQTRGPYVRKSLGYSSNDEREVRILEANIASYLNQNGYSVSGTCCQDMGRGYSTSSFAYHVAGVTVGINARYYKKPTPTDPNCVPQYSLRMNLVTNDNLDEILQKITTKFPEFESIAHQP